MLTNLIQNIGHGFGNARGAFLAGYQKASGGWRDLEAIWSSVLGESTTNRKRTAALQLREFQSWIYIILTTIYGRTSTVPWNLKVQRPDNTLENLNNQHDHPLHKLLTKPNPFMTGTFFQQIIQTQLDLTGMAMIWKIRNGLRRPAELWPLNISEFMDFIPGTTTKDFIKGYRFTNMEFPVEDIIYLYYPNPNPTFFSTLASQQTTNLFASLAGMSPIQAMARTVDIEKYIEVYERDFFENSARPDVILTMNEKKNLGEPERERILTKWKQKHQGPRKFWEPTILKDMTAEILKTNNKDFQLAKTANWTKDMLFATYSVPEGKAGLVKDINRANQIGVDITFNEECIQPRLNLWDETFTNQLAHEFDEKLVIQHDNPVPSDKEFILKRQEFEVKNYIKSINQIRDESGLDNVDWGDKPWMPLNLVQAGSSPVGEGEPGKLYTVPVQLETKNWLDDPERRKAYWKRFDARAKKHELLFIKVMRKLFADQQREVLANLARLAPQIESQFAGWHKGKVARYIKKNPRLVAGILFDEKEQIKVFEKAGKPLISDAFEDAGTEMFSDLDIEFSFDLHNARADKFIKGRAGKYAGQVVGTTHKTLRETLLEGFREGESVSQLAKRIRHEFDIADRHRAIVIARTEVIGASNAGSLEGMRQSGVVKKKEWLASLDDRVRDSHVSMDGQVVGINELFTSGDGNTAQHPGGFGVAEEDIQCRCTTVPVIEV
jgi:SPP1 gp7 family putative phage head morphogenesis protein